MTKYITAEEIAKHDVVNDLWVTIDGKVYDLTRFVGEHPGGEEILVDEGGRDATAAFEDIGHSQGARELLKDYYIGELVKDEKNVSSSIPLSKGYDGTRNHSAVKPTGLLIAAALGFVGLMLTVYLKK